MEGIQRTEGSGGPKWVSQTNTEGTQPAMTGQDDLRNLVGLPMAQFLQELMKKRLEDELLEEVLTSVAEGALAQLSPEALQSGLINLDKLLDKLPPEIAAKVRAAVNKFLTEVGSAANTGELPGKDVLLSGMQEALKGCDLEPGQSGVLTASQDALYVAAIAAWKVDPAGLQGALGTAGSAGGGHGVGPDPSQRV